MKSSARTHRSVRQPLAVLTALVLAAGTPVLAAQPAAAAEPGDEISTTDTQLRSFLTSDGEMGLVQAVNNGSEFLNVKDGTAAYRLASSSAYTVPDLDEFSWLAPAGTEGFATRGSYESNAELFGLSLGTVDPAGSNYADQLVEGGRITFDFSNVRGPGSFSVYRTPDLPFLEPAGLEYRPLNERFGTGVQRDGTPQNTFPFEIAPRRSQAVRAFFTEPGMYCIDLTTTAPPGRRIVQDRVNYRALRRRRRGACGCRLRRSGRRHSAGRTGTQPGARTQPGAGTRSGTGTGAD